LIWINQRNLTRSETSLDFNRSLRNGEKQPMIQKQTTTAAAAAAAVQLVKA
jgi:hypothetical protein